MQVQVWEWLNVLVRCFHLIAGIGWIGSSFYFMWLDASLEAPSPAKEGVEGELWMVHSGGFYQVEKRLIGPGSMPKTLHWFKYEALFTWISGVFLLGIVYYLSGGVYLIDANKWDLSLGGAIGVSLGVIAASWLLYDKLWASKIAADKPKVATVVTLVWLFLMVFALSKVFTGRGAFIHVGAILGTIMVANVWHRILPNQQKMIDATRAGEKPDYSLGIRAKHRSVHNSYATLPVIFMMVSNHYPELYSGDLNWLVLVLMILLGGLVRHIMILETKNKNGWPWAVPTVATLGAVIFLTAASGPKAAKATDEKISGQERPVVQVSDDEAMAIIHARCTTCHSSQPSDDVFRAAPNGVVFDQLTDVRKLADRVKTRAVITKTMPLGNKTGITDEERQKLGAWLDPH